MTKELKWFGTLLLVMMVAFMASCSGCSSNTDKKKKDTIPTFVKADTTAVVRLTEDYLNLVKENRYDEAIEKLSEITNDSVAKLSKETEEMVRKQQKMFPILDYKLDTMEFINEHKVRMTYRIKFMESEDPQFPTTTRLTFSPQRINAQWYLELLSRSEMK